MPYQAEQDVTIPRPIGSREIPGTGQRVELKESVNYVAGSIVLEKDMTAGIKRRLEEGTDDHLSGLLRYVDPAEARQILGRQARVAASQVGPESQVLHQEERLESDGPHLSTETEVPYEEPVGGGSGADDSQHVVTDDQTLAQGTEAVLPATEKTEVETDTEGSSESTGEAETEVVQETEAEASEDESTSDVEEAGQDQASDTQGNSTEESGDEYDSMDFDALRKEVRKREIEGRSKLKTEEQFREALRKDDAASE